MSADSDKLRDYLKRVTVDLRKTKRRLREVEDRGHEPIAIVGMSCRYPGGASTPQKLWELAASGTDAVGEFPADRDWPLARLFDPDPDNPETTYCRHGGFVYDVADFDAAFFGISPREALAMDPQQRLLLEGAWEAIEDAGIDPAALRGSRTGVFAGISSSDYGVGLEGPDSAGYRITGRTSSVGSGRVSYVLGLEGPAVSVDTACSSSLVTMHLACQALRHEECDMALAGGVMVLAWPGLFIEFARQRVLSPDGRCKSFAEAADGAGFSEGMGLVLLERLSHAQERGHEVLAVIRGSAVNQDGASNGLTAPNGPSQERVIAQALADARISPASVAAVEAHGTGTPLGDPIEAGALLATYGHERADDPLRLGSIKSNIGHTGTAAGAAGVIKMVKALREGLLPPTLHVDAPSSQIDWSEGEIDLLTEALPWEANGSGPRRAGVSSFGISGTNAHLILEEAPALEEVAPDGDDEEDAGGEATTLPFRPGTAMPMLISAKTEGALDEAAERLRSHLGEHPDLSRTDVAFSLATTRSALERRAVLGRELEVVSQATARPSGPIVFTFPGQGSQWEGMALDLLEASPVFARKMAECEEALGAFVPFSMKEALEGKGDSQKRLDIIQPALFSVMVSLAELWRSVGVVPDVVLGHSQGEIAAAHVAGGLSLEDAARVVALRARALTGIAGKGGMVSVALGTADLEPLIEGLGDRIGVAAINGPAATVLSGEVDALKELIDRCEEADVRSRLLPVDYASHCSQVEEIREELLDSCASIEPRSGEATFFSTLLGAPVDTADLDAEYWYRNLREPVCFEESTRSLIAEGHRTFLELSPHPVLTVGITESVEAEAGDPAAALVAGTLRRDEGGADRFLAAAAELWTAGVEVDWAAAFAGSGARRTQLPTYPFQRRRYWFGSRGAGGDMSEAGLQAADHPLLGAAIPLAEGDGTLYSGRLSLESQPWVGDHMVGGVAVVPGVTFAELAFAASAGTGCEVLEELVVEAPLVLAEREAVQLQVSLAGPDEDGRRAVAVHSRPEGEDAEEAEWTRHASGSLGPAGDGPEVDPDGLASLDGAWPPEGAEPVSAAEFYEYMATIGLDYGPAFLGVRALWKRDGKIFAELGLAEKEREGAHAFGIHPALMDAGIQTFASAAMGAETDADTLRLPFAFDGIRLHAAGSTDLRMRVSFLDDDVSLIAVDPSGVPVVSMRSMRAREITRDQLAAAGDPHRDSLFTVGWSPVPGGEGISGPIALVGGEDVALVEALASSGDVVEAHPGLDSLVASLDAGDGERGEGDGNGDAGEATEGDRGQVEEPAAPATIVLDARRPASQGEDLPDAARELAVRVLTQIQAVLAAEALAGSRVVVLTKGAVATGETEDPDDLGAAPLWGLVRSAQSEEPGRLRIVDLDGDAASPAALPAALASEEPQVAIRERVLLAPRLRRVRPAADEDRALDPERTVLVTGATGTLGALVARHLVESHGARHLLLASRRGEGAPGAAELREELESLGATVTIAARDVADRAEVEALVAGVPAEHPLGAVVHAAGALEDATVATMDPASLGRVLAPKADAAWHLHELTAGLELTHFVLFSSVAGTLGSPGQGNYAAANAFLDALAAHRRAAGLAATSIAWGLWDPESELTSSADRDLLARAGIAAITVEQGLGLLDVALAAPDPLLVAAPLDKGALRAAASAGLLPPILSGLVRMPARRAGGGGGRLARQLAETPEAEREKVVLDQLMAEIAAVLGHASPNVLDPEAPFKDAGFDSLSAVELRNRMNAMSGLRLPATMVFDHPTPAAVARYLAQELSGVKAAPVLAAVAVRSAEEPIAIVGMSCRYPGGVTSPEGLWEMVAEGRDAISEFPADRGWDLGRIYDPDPEVPGTTYSRHGGFVHDAPDFDAAFFGISPREALAMDPQQRLLLEGAWEVFEDAGMDPAALKGSRTGVFVGIGSSDYGLGGLTQDLGGYRVTGGAGSVASGRLSYNFGLEGPAVSIDTACSSSLVAMHLASQALRQGECEMALVGGVMVLSSPALFVEFARVRGLSPDGRCRSFAESADGTTWSEGVGMVLLEPLSTAREQGHEVLALIKGSAVNQDGASNGLTAPNGPSQQRVIAQALANARLSPGEVDAVEAHGTATILGDPIEAQALLATYGRERTDGPLQLGSIKSNMGHAATAAGVAGVIKMVGALRHEMLPPTLHAEERSSHVDWAAGAVELLTEPRPWPANGRPRRAGISSFGISGTNAHLILEEAPVVEAAPVEETPEDGADARPLPFRPGTDLPFVLSARTEPALREAAGRLAAQLEADPGQALGDVAFSLATARGALEQRAAVSAGDRAELMAGLAALGRGEHAPGLAEGRAARGPLACLFTGQGSQRVGMGGELIEASPLYAAAFEEVSAALDEHLAEPLVQIVLGTHPDAAELLADTTYAQPALFAVEVALARLMEALGLRPGLLAGHSIGEIVAAHLARVLSLPDAARLVAARGALMGALPAGGAMFAVEVTEDEAIAALADQGPDGSPAAVDGPGSVALAGHEADASLAAVNGPRSVVISGTEEVVAAVAERLATGGARTKRLEVSHAFHSPLIEPMLDDFAEVVRGLDLHEPRIPIVSNVTGKVLTPAEATDPAYWVRHVREPVRFADSVATLREQGAAAFCELGPDGVLSAMVPACLTEEPLTAIPLLRGERPEAEALTGALAGLWAVGIEVDWAAAFAGSGAKRAALPTYPFQRRRFWIDPGSEGGGVGGGHHGTEHPLLGSSVALAEGDGALFAGRLSLESQPWLADHTVLGTVPAPGAVFVELALHAGSRLGCERVEELSVDTPLVLPDRGAVQVQLAVGGVGEDGRRPLAIHSRPEGEEEAEWTRHARGSLAPAGEPSAALRAEAAQLTAWPPRDAEPLDPEAFYEHLADAGLEYGPAFQGLTAAWRRGEELFAELSLAEDEREAAESYGLHPALLDAALQAVGLDAGPGAEPRLPLAFGGAELFVGGASSLRLRLRPDSDAGASLLLVDEAGEIVFALDSTVAREVSAAGLGAAEPHRDSLFVTDWIPIATRAAASAASAGTLAVLGGEESSDPSRMLLDCTAPAGDGEDVVAAAHRVTARVLAEVQRRLAEGRLADVPLVVVTHEAIAVKDSEPVAGLAASPLWGLLRSAQAEVPGHFVLVDVDDPQVGAGALAGALDSGEPQLAIRAGRLLAPRLRRVESPARSAAVPFDPQRTVLLTGATGSLGPLLARHLVEVHGARQLLLVGRRGEEARGGAELREELEALGATVTIAACDVADRARVEALIDSIPAEHPLGAVIHAAGTVDDATVATLDAGQLDAVLAPKVDGAWHLHEATADLELTHFVLFSSGAGTLGDPGQGNNAAANAFLDSLAAHRWAAGLPATAIGWAPWEVAARLDDAARARLARHGLPPLESGRGLALFDAALALGEARPLAIPFDFAVLRTAAKAGLLPPILGELVRVPARRSAGRDGGLAKRLAATPEGEREGLVRDLVLAEVATVLGHASPAAIDPRAPFQDAGFDSLAAVELRNRLEALSGLPLPVTLVFDYPTPADVAGYLHEQATREGGGAASLDAEIDRLEGMLDGVAADERGRAQVAARLRALAGRIVEDGAAAEDRAALSEKIETASDEELFEFFDREGRDE